MGGGYQYIQWPGEDLTDIPWEIIYVANRSKLIPVAVCTLLDHITFWIIFNSHLIWTRVIFVHHFDWKVGHYHTTSGYGLTLVHLHTLIAVGGRTAGWLIWSGHTRASARSCRGAARTSWGGGVKLVNFWTKKHGVPSLQNWNFIQTKKKKKKKKEAQNQLYWLKTLSNPQSRYSSLYTSITVLYHCERMLWLRGEGHRFNQPTKPNVQQWSLNKASS